MSLLECSNFPNNCGQLSANIEIEGVGVFISFLATALLTLLAAVLRLPCQLVLHPCEYEEHAAPEYHDFDHKSEKGTAASLYHTAKERVRFYRRWILLKYANRPNHPRYRLLNAALTPLILSLADQQLVTSSAVMIAGLYSWNTISAYHYNIIVYLAWFSTFTHTVALVSMSDHFFQNKVLAGIRLCGYEGNFILFIVTQHRARNYGDTAGLFLLKVHYKSGISGGAAACLAKCAANIPYKGYDHQFRITIMVLLFFQVFLQCIPQCIRNGFSLATYNRLLRLLRITDEEKCCLWLAYIFQAVIISFWLLPIIPILLALVFGVAEQQNAWTFGQFVACILLILPLLAAIEGYFEEREKICTENHAAGLPSHHSQWKHRVNRILKVTHLGKPPTSNNLGVRSRMTIWADDNSVDHPADRGMERPGTAQTSSAQHSRLSQPSDQQTSVLQPTSPKLFTNESGEPIMLPYSKPHTPGLEREEKISKQVS